MNKCFYLLSLILINELVLGSENVLEKGSKRQKKSLLFPQYSVLQTSMCLISRISSLDSHRVALNLGFQTNYQLPYQLPSFYSPIFWARKLSHASNPLVNFFERIAESNDESEEVDERNNDASDETSTELTTTTEASEFDEMETTEAAFKNQTVEHHRHKRMISFDSDISAGQFYYGIIDVLGYAGYNEECLLKSVCELAKHPIHFDENEDVVKEILHFLLTPSAHQSFDAENEIEEKELYEEAERIGKEGGDCELIYNECKVSPLYSISNFIPNDD
ncbi:uncharacterized protein [Chironomus tepperi]|uniref:uncharacterized protein n=1 Tax=Chironomus tepperi TaxID=113505 RepID=UPI00391F9032